MISKTIWLRHETKPFEERCALTPEAAQILMGLGHEVVIERSPTRIFKDEEFEAAGCKMMPTNSWINMAPKNAYILGLKELEDRDFPLTHRHIHFAHVYKNQTGSEKMLDRFFQGDGKLFDLEYLTDNKGKRIAAFGKWAGFVGAAVGLQNWICQQKGINFNNNSPLNSYASQFELVNDVAKELEELGKKPRVLVIGHRGRCGSGAKELLTLLGIETTAWGRAETSQLQRPIKEILDFDILVNCTLNTSKAKPFLDKEIIKLERNLSVISDVSCDPTGPCNPLPIYPDITTIDRPTFRLDTKELLEVTAIDHLPSLLPRESTEEYVEQLLPHIINLLSGEIENSPWERSLEWFYRKTIELGLEKRPEEETHLLM